MPKTLADFEVIKTLGRGTFGTVSLAKVKKEDYLVALKKMNKTKNKNEIVRQLRAFKNEIELHAPLQHENVVRLLGFFSDELSVHLILEFVPKGSLYGLLPKNGFSERDCVNYTKQVAMALVYLHNQ